jgi:carboxyl-terminal processing protease
MKSLRSTILTLGACVLLLAAGWQLGASYERSMMGVEFSVVSGSGDTMIDPQTADLSSLFSVWALLQRTYVDPAALQPGKLILGATEGLVRGVGDPYTVFMPPKENKAFRGVLSGTLEGIGAELTMKDGIVTVVSPLKGSPAEKAGLLPGDVIVKVDGETLQGLTLDDVVDRIRGPKGTNVALLVGRTSAPGPLTFTIRRATVSVPSVESKVLTQSGAEIGYITLNQFGDHSTDEVRQALLSFKNKNLQGLILDLRNNGGGYLNGAVDIASMFLQEGRVVSVVSRGGQTEHQDVSGEVIVPDLPMVVLINQASASASEILAGALQDHQRAVIVGMQSFGKGTVQEVIDLPDGSSVRVTIARWHTPNGKDLSKAGVTPDVQVEPKPGDSADGSDAQLQAALEALLHPAANN